MPPEFKDFSGPVCQDPACYRERPHFPREYGCRWSSIAIDNKDGTTTILNLAKTEAENDPGTSR